MSHRSLARDINSVLRLFGKSELAPLSDRALLDAHVRGNEQAFSVLFERHAAMVWSTCRALAGRWQDAEDAFQAAWLVLAQKASSVRWGETVGPWLHQTALRLSKRGFSKSVLRNRREIVMAPDSLDAPAPMEDRELSTLVQEGLGRLPEKLRAPMVLCYLEGRSNSEAARLLGWPEGSIAKRLKRGREILQEWLAIRGVCLSSLALTGILSSAASAMVAPTLAASTLQAAELMAKGASLAVAAPAPVAALVQGLLRETSWSKIAWLLAPLASWGANARWFAVALFLLIGSGIALLMFARLEPSSGFHETESPKAAAAMSWPGDDPDELARANSLKKVDLPGRVVDPDGQPVANADVTALARRPFMPGEQSLRDEVLAVGKTDAHGFFRLPVATDFPTWYPERRVTLLVHAPGQAIRTVQVSLPSASGKPPPSSGGGGDHAADRHSERSVEVRLPKAGVVRGRLLDPEGKPAQGVPLRLERLGNAAYEPNAAVRASLVPQGWPKQVVTDAEGRFDLAGIGQSEPVSLRVEDERYAPHVLRITPDEAEASVQLEFARWMEGRAIAADTGKPIAGLRVSAHVGSQQGIPVHTVADEQITRIRWLSTHDTLTDESGRFRIRLFRRLAYELELYPPAGSPYLAVRKLQIPHTAGIAKDFALPRGVVVHGRLVDEAAKPVAGGSVFWDAPVGGDNPHCDKSIIQDSLSIAAVDATGQFTLTVPAGQVRLQAFGPTQDYVPRQSSEWTRSTAQEQPRWLLAPTSPASPANYCHAEAFLDLPSDTTTSSVHLVLRKGKSIEGEVRSADGQPVPHAVLLCSGRVSPLRNGLGQPLPVKNGRFVLPGCEAGKLYTVLVLDTKRGEGALAQLACPGEPARPPRIQLEPCGEARVRVQSNGSAPLPYNYPYLYPYLFLHLPKPYPIADPPKGPLPVDVVEDFGIDLIYMHENRRVGKDGAVTLPCLIPRAEYVLCWQLQKRPISHFGSRPFTVQPGEVRRLTDIVAGLPGDETESIWNDGSLREP